MNNSANIKPFKYGKLTYHGYVDVDPMRKHNN